MLKIELDKKYLSGPVETWNRVSIERLRCISPANHSTIS